MLFSLSTLLSTVTLASMVASHGLLTEVAGANGVMGKAFAIVEGTPRTTDV